MFKEIGQFLKQDFTLLDSTINKLILIGFIGLYSAFFISVYTPFNINTWGQNSYMKYVLLGIAVISFSQFVLRPVFGFKTFNNSTLILWGIFELIVMATVLHLAYAPSTASNTFEANFFDYLDTIRIVILVATIPYVLVVLYLVFKEKLSTLKDLKDNSQGTIINKGDKLLTLTGENNKVILAIKYHQLLYVKSAGNYLELYYLKGENLAKELVRERLKELEKKIINTNVVKVHRSYLVNVRHISSLKKTKKSYEIIVQHIPDVIIPVSSGFKASFEEALKQKVSH
ncbi:MAG: LytTR family transcriptional regulator [Maribacter sp.]|nr:LytTR family transcriptional regulator [Maribacter sp.]